MFLVDTSIWIEVFKKRSALDLEALLPFDEIVTCLPVVQEVLQGFRDEGAYRTAYEAMHAIPIVDAPLGRDVFDEAIQLFRSCRRNGYTIRSGVDCLIAASAIRHQLTVVHKDRDFDTLARLSPLLVRSVQ